MKDSTEVLKYSTEGVNIPRRCQIFHGGGQIFHKDKEYSTEVFKCSMEASNIAQRCLNIPRRCLIFHGGVQWSTEGVKCSTRYELFHGAA